MIFCIKNTSWKVSYQNSSCKVFCGERLGHTCRDGCRVYANTRLEDGFHFYTNKDLRGGCYDIVFFVEQGRLLTMISSVEDRHMSTLDQAKHLNLTKREKEIFLLRLRKLSNREIEGRLHISHSTMKTHINNIGKKLNSLKRMVTS